ncbi:tRNA (adenosine(37)-N6)-dimethylallyltransferase MiaA ['Elaeagnus angustifolia' witches'-broom phytoplasma]|uniref:tRNA dimethylallyltransferase n=1 Tax='Elaeagnus angustifolia' witches'-broom phytoplasma TaxID=1538355 RepID=A0ABS5V8A9_9MOLU|nr:tRNA (adenosine(37)-N6)-dimethylallyltransferase MiaA ['Elaeagnus angustifolia' witches'-broom phytoplasma]MCX2955466.1 tRNA (adenosine(37)-N6)-dimethylallyltransferase MiaA [Candidatus Phytoplasma australiense]
MKKVIAITGPTASGKTSLSIKIAKKINLEIINCDSLQMYQKYDIGTAKITLEEAQGIKHHLLDFLAPGTNYSIYHFQKDARKKIEETPLPLFVGGSGLYLKSALFDYELTPKSLFLPPTSLPAIENMIDFIKQKDPQLIANLDLKNPHRILSAYQDLLAGTLRSQKNKKHNPLYSSLIFYLDIDRQILKKRVILRLEQMLKQGFIEEVNQIQTHFPTANFNIIGYREIKALLEGKITLDQAKTLIIQKTMQYAKRQKTWFKNQIKPIILDALSPDLEKTTICLINDFLKTD